jgi:trans-aconitate 2-methyltransferase
MPLKLIHGPPNSGRAGLIRGGFVAALGRDPVLEWVKGTALRPVLSHLRANRPDLEAQFLEELADRLANAYKTTTGGTIFPFRRIFAVGHRVSNS